MELTSLAVLFYGYIFDHSHILNHYILPVFTDQHTVTASKANLCWFLSYFNGLLYPVTKCCDYTTPSHTVMVNDTRL
jgi:hypothetical protein